MAIIRFMTITQQGFTFHVSFGDKMVAEEDWTIERVAAFMSVHHTLNLNATHYAKGLTYRTAVAAIQYTLKCDPPTSADLNKLTKYLVPKLCGIYEDADRQSFLGRPLSAILDDVTAIAEKHVEHEQEPIIVFGKVCPVPPFYSRPTEAEYNAAIEAEKNVEQQYWDNFRKHLAEGKAIGHKILIREGGDVYTGIIVKTSDKCVYCDVKDEYGRLLQSGARFPKESKRFIIESFR